MDKRIRVRINNRVVEVVLVPFETHRSNKVVYHELNESGQPVREHSFQSALLQFDTGSFWTNGNHYMTGALVDTPCRSNCSCCK